MIKQPRICKFLIFFFLETKKKSHSINKINNDLWHGQNFRLEPDVTEKFIQLLTIDLDAKRELRVEGDQFCRMFNEIQNKQRNITLADVEIPDFNWTIDY